MNRPSRPSGYPVAPSHPAWASRSYGPTRDKGAEFPAQDFPGCTLGQGRKDRDLHLDRGICKAIGAISVKVTDDLGSGFRQDDESPEILLPLFTGKRYHAQLSNAWMLAQQLFGILHSHVPSSLGKDRRPPGTAIAGQDPSEHETTGSWLKPSASASCYSDFAWTLCLESARRVPEPLNSRADLKSLGKKHLATGLPGGNLSILFPGDGSLTFCQVSATSASQFAQKG